jgi:hypothetical protein
MALCLQELEWASGDNLTLDFTADTKASAFFSSLMGGGIEPIVAPNGQIEFTLTKISQSLDGSFTPEITSVEFSAPAAENEPIPVMDLQSLTPIDTRATLQMETPLAPNVEESNVVDSGNLAKKASVTGAAVATSASTKNTKKVGKGPLTK